IGQPLLRLRAPAAHQAVGEERRIDRPAEVPEMPSTLSRSSLRRWSSTPQVKAPWAPPPCKARLTRLVFCAPRASAAAPGSSELRSFFMRRSFRGARRAYAETITRTSEVFGFAAWDQAVVIMDSGLVAVA